MENIGQKFGLIILMNAIIHEYWLPICGKLSGTLSTGLTATPERRTMQSAYSQLIGALAYRRDVSELAGEYLADYDTVRVAVKLDPAERIAYDEARFVYREFVRMNGIRMSRPDGWGRFIQLSARSRDGREAMKAYQKQRALSFAAPSKLRYVEHLLWEHRRDKTLIFTQDNATAYTVSREFLVPVITHQTKVKERSEYLAGFSEGRYSVIATSKVLNEGVDVPDANVAIVMSGSGSVREHVQRLGRILRKSKDKRAILYELVAEGTAEQYTSQRRREHNAYR